MMRSNVPRLGLLLVAIPVASIAFGCRAPSNDLLWLRTSAEYEAVCRTVYAEAERALRLETAVDDAPCPSVKRRAVIMDLDETVLDNTLFNIWLHVARDGRYTNEAWVDWVRRNDDLARLVPGVDRFLASARRADVDVVFVSNRPETVRSETTRTLRRLGALPADMPDASVDEVLLLREVKADGQLGSSSKNLRREGVERRWCVISLIGDNLADFAGKYEQGTYRGDDRWEQRRAVVGGDGALWGTRWFALPNPSYGDWRTILTDEDIDGVRTTAIEASRRDPSK